MTPLYHRQWDPQPDMGQFCFVNSNSTQFRLINSINILSFQFQVKQFQLDIHYNPNLMHKNSVANHRPLHQRDELWNRSRYLKIEKMQKDI